MSHEALYLVIKLSSPDLILINNLTLALIKWPVNGKKVEILKNRITEEIEKIIIGILKKKSWKRVIN